MRGVSKVGAQGLAATWSVEVVCSWPSRLLKREALSLELQHRTLRQSVILSQGYTPRVFKGLLLANWVSQSLQL
jgi:hypothetical protein